MESLLGGGLLYCDARFHDLNGVPPACRFRYEHRREDRLVGVLDGVVTDGVFISGHSAPFGGPDFVRDDPTVEDVLGLVEGAVGALRDAGVGELLILARPPVYSSVEPLLEYALLHLGFGLELCLLNQHVDLLPLRDGADPLALIRKNKRGIVRAGLAGAHELAPVSGGEELTAVHDILAGNRASLGRPPGLSREYLERAHAQFGDRVRLLLLRVEGDPVAAAVVYRVLDDVDQLIAWGDVRGVLRHSPMDLLAHLLVVASLENGARLLDLGPSSEKDGSPNVGLINFKRSVGGVPGTRKVFARSLA